MNLFHKLYTSKYIIYSILQMGTCKSIQNGNRKQSQSNTQDIKSSAQNAPKDSLNGSKTDPILTAKNGISGMKASGTNTKELTTHDQEKEVAFGIEKSIFIAHGEGTPFQNYTVKNSDAIGEGSYGEVFRAKHKLTGTVRAMKIIKKAAGNKKDKDSEVMNEIELLKQMDHPSIVKIFEFYNSNDNYYLITELCKEGELFNLIKDFGAMDEHNSAYIMYQILSAVHYCHSISIIHRDLKPENLLIEKKEKSGFYRIKVIDFGTAKIFEKNKIEKKVTGSSYYIAPEVLDKNYNEKCDLWSCGVIMYILLCASPPFGGNTDQEIFKKIKIGNYDIKSSPWHKISKEAKHLISLLLEKNPNLRISASEALNHKWFKNLNTRAKLNELKPDKIKKCLSNLKNYNPTLILQQATLAYLVHNNPQLEEVQEACKLFNLIDENNDGRIIKEELLSGLRKYLQISEEILVEDVNKIFHCIDADGNGYIEYEEFVRGAINKEKFLADDIIQFAFSYFDRDGSGEITSNEIKEVFCKNRHGVAVDKALKQIIDEVDQNGDNKISLDEFKYMMKSILDIK